MAGRRVFQTMVIRVLSIFVLLRGPSWFIRRFQARPRERVGVGCPQRKQSHQVKKIKVTRQPREIPTHNDHASTLRRFSIVDDNPTNLKRDLSFIRFSNRRRY